MYWSWKSRRINVKYIYKTSAWTLKTPCFRRWFQWLKSRGPHLAEGKNMEKRVKAQWYFRRCQFLDLNPVRLALKPEIGSDGLPQPTPLPVNLPQRLTRISFQRTGCQAGGLVKWRVGAVFKCFRSHPSSVTAKWTTNVFARVLHERVRWGSIDWFDRLFASLPFSTTHVKCLRNALANLLAGEQNLLLFCVFAIWFDCWSSLDWVCPPWDIWYSLLHVLCARFSVPSAPVRAGF